MKKSIFIFLILVSLQLGNFQPLYSQNWQWAISCAKGEDNDYGTISTDASSNIYLTGVFSGPAGIFGNDSLIPVGWLGSKLPIMFCGLDSSGNFQWVKGITVQGNPCNTAISSKVATNKNYNGTWFYGHVCGNLFFDSVHLESMTSQVFLARYDVNGNCIWARESGGQGDVYSHQACVDNFGNIYLSGIAIDSVQFDSFTVGPGNFLVKYDANGNCIWVKNICDGSIFTYGIAVTINQIILVSEAATVGASFSLAGYPIDCSNSNLVLASFDTTGNAQWAKADGIGFCQNLTNCGFDSANYFYFCGQYNNFIFGQDTLLNSSSCPQLFIVKYDSFGNVIWARNSSGNNTVTPTQLALGNDGNCYITGRLAFYMVPNSTTTFGSCYATIAADPLNVEMFVVRYDANGNCLGVTHVPTDLSGPNPSGGTSVAQDSYGNCIVAGQFIQTTSFDAHSLTSMGARDIFIAKCDAFTGNSVEEKLLDDQLVIYANPNLGKCNIILPEEFRHEQHLTLSIFNNQGKLIQQTFVEIISDEVSLNIAAEAKGIYTAVLTNGRKNYTGKIVFK